MGVGGEGWKGESGSGRTQSMTIKEVSEMALSNSALLGGESNVSLRAVNSATAKNEVC